MTCGERIKELREHKHIKQIEIAMMCNVTQSTVSAWEKDRAVPNLDRLTMLARYFEVSIDYLVSGNETVYVEAMTGMTEDEKLMLTRYRSLNDEDKELLRAEALRMKRANSAQIAGAS